MVGQRTGTTTSAAAERIRAGEHVRKQTQVRNAAAKGDLSAEQTAAISDAIAADPNAEQRLVDEAGHGSLSDLRSECDRTKTSADPDPEATHARIRGERSVRFWSQAGVARMFANTTPEQMAPIKTAVERRADELFHAARAAGAPQPREHYLMDALEQICREFLGDTSHTDTDETETEMAKGKPTAAPIYLGLVRVDHAALVRGHVEGEEICEIAGLGPIPVSVARKLLGKALLYLVTTKGTAVANVVNIKRGPTVAQRIALLWQSPTCAVDGCNVIHVDIDHVEPWAATKQTVLGDLEPLCDHHHDLKSHHEWEVITDHDGRRIIVPPDDPRHRGPTEAERRQDTDAA